jgi:hypothetical protein
MKKRRRFLLEGRHIRTFELNRGFWSELGAKCFLALHRRDRKSAGLIKCRWVVADGCGYSPQALRGGIAYSYIEESAHTGTRRI